MSVTSLLAQFDEEDAAAEKGALAKSAVIVHNVNPDKHAENVNRAKRQGMPAALATPAAGPVSPDDMNDLIADYKNLKGVTAERMKDPNFAKVVVKDHGELTAWEGLFKPLLKAVPRVVAHTAASMVQMPISGLSATGKFVSTAVKTRGDFGTALIESNKVVEENQKTLDDYYLTTDEERKGAENIGLAMKPFQMAGRGWAGIAELATGGVQGATDVVEGRSPGSNIAVPLMGTLGEAAAMFGFGGAGKAIGLRLDTIADSHPLIYAGHIVKAVDTANKSKVRRRAPEEYEAHVKATTEEFTPPTVSVEKAEEIMSSAGKTPEEFFSDPVLFYNAKLEGKPVEIPIVDIVKNAEHITPDHIKDMSVNGASTVNEIAAKAEATAKEATAKGGDIPKDSTTKESSLAVRAEADAIEAKLTEDFGPLAEYKTMNMKDQAERAQSVMEKDYEAAKRMAMGEELPPDGIREATMYEAVKIRAIAEGDVATLHKLATESTVPTKLSEYGQAIKAADSGLTMDPVKDMQAVAKERAENAAKRGENPEAMAQLEELTRKLNETQDKLTAYEEAASKKQAEKIVKEIKAELAGKTTRKAARAASKEVLDTEFKSLSGQLKQILNPDKLNAGIDPSAIPILIEMAKNRIQSGIITVEGVVDSVYHEVKDLIDVTKREVRDAISGYGKTADMSKDEINVQLRELKRQARLISALEDAQSGNAPLRSGLKRDPVSDTVRELQKEVKQAMRESGIDSKSTLSPEEQFKTSLDAVKTRLRNQIHDLTKQLETGEKTPRKKGIEYDAEAKALAAERDNLKAALEKVEGKPEMSPEQRIKVATEAVKKSIAELERRIKEKDVNPAKKASKTPETPELKGLRKQRDELSAKWEEQKKLLEEMQKKGVPDEAPEITQLNKFMADTERKVKVAEKALQKSIEEYQRRIAENDLHPQKPQSTTPETPAMAKMKAAVLKLKEEYKQMQKDAQPPKDPEAAKLKSFKTRVTNEIARFEKALAEGDFAKKERKPVTLDAEGKKLKAERDRAKEDYQAGASATGTITKAEAAEIVRLSKATTDAKAAMEQGGDRFAYGAARVAYENYVNDLKGANLPVKTLLKNYGQELKTTWGDNKAKAVWDAGTGAIKAISDNSIAMVASLDNSFLGRQGLKTLMTHPSAWLDGAKNSFIDFAKVLGGKNAHDALLADVYSRPNFLNGEYHRAKIIAKAEEQFPTTLPERIPGVGRVFKASEAAFTGSGLRMRTDLYDLLSSKAKENGVDMASKVEAESLGKLVNSLTARGQWGTRGESAVVRVVLWAPKMLKANIDVLTAHNFGAGLESRFARREAAINLLKITAETATLMAIANALIPGSAETDPKSTDFGKIKVGDTRFDITGGAASVVTLASRIITRSSKNTQSGLVTEYGLGFGKRSPFDALIDFITNKTAPAAGVVVSWLKGEDREGKPFTWGGATFRSFTPISLQNAIKLKDDASADKLAGVILDLIGISSNSYGDGSEHRRDIVNRLRNDKPLTEEQQEAYDSMTDSQKRSIDAEAEMTAMQAAFSELPNESMIYAWSKASNQEREELRDIYENRIDMYILKNDLDGEELDELNDRIQKAEERKL